MPDTNPIQALRESAVLLEGPGHDVLRATGNDRVSFLARITSGTVASLDPGRGGRTLLLDVRGRVLASLLAFVRGKSVRLITASGQGAEIVAGLSKYAIMDDFQIVPESELATLAVLGPKAGEALEGIGIAGCAALLAAPLFNHHDTTSERFGLVWVAHGRASGTDGLCIVAAKSARDALAEALRQSGVVSLPAEIADALRIAALEPAVGKEIAPDRFPVEVGLGKAIDHGKGCYVGQETIVRMRDRGVIRKRLVLLQLQEGGTASPGDKVTAEGQANAGLVTSVGALPGRPPVALGIVASAVPVGASVQIQHAEAPAGAEIVGESPPWG
jgi:folate-binding protein YgfZ